MFEVEYATINSVVAVIFACTGGVVWSSGVALRCISIIVYCEIRPVYGDNVVSDPVEILLHFRIIGGVWSLWSVEFRAVRLGDELIDFMAIGAGDLGKIMIGLECRFRANKCGLNGFYCYF
jgi:hypothetical protein